MGAMGYRGHRGYKNKADRVKKWSSGDFCDAMAGEISPNMMFLQIRRKGEQLHAKGE